MGLNMMINRYILPKLTKYLFTLKMPKSSPCSPKRMTEYANQAATRTAHEVNWLLRRNRLVRPRFVR